MVWARITLDADGEEVVLVEPSSDICRNREHALVDGGPRNLETVLVYDDDGSN